jgi:hypothetical protein
MKRTSSRLSTPVSSIVAVVSAPLAALALGILAAPLVVPDAAAAELDIGLVTELDRSEPYEGHLFHDSRLWVTRSRATDAETHRVEVYGEGGTTRLATVPLTHNAGFIYPFGPRAVVIVGRSADPWISKYTVVTREGETYKTRVTALPEEYQVEQFAGSPTALYFTEPGSRAVYQWGGGSMKPIGGEISGPGAMELDGASLWVLERKSFQLGDENLVRVDTRTGAASRVFDESRAGLTALLAPTRGPWVAAVETLADQIVFVDKTSAEPVFTVAVEGGPRGLTQLGGCLLATSEDSKTVSFISLWSDEPALLETWDVSAAGDRLKKPRRIAADPETGRVFLRSTYICPSCTVPQSSVFYVQSAEDGGDVVAKCLAN